MMGAYSDDHWYIVGGGPSLKDFNWSLLDGLRVIAVNRAFEKLPGAEIVYFTDHRFWGWHRESLLCHDARLITGARVKHAEHPRLERVKLSGVRGLDTRLGYVRHGNNSGYAAINVAYHMGARRIYLFGFDFRYGKSGAVIEKHWHSDHPALHRERVFTKMLPHFTSLARELGMRGVEVWNANPSSALGVFPKCTFDSALTDDPPRPTVEALGYLTGRGESPQGSQAFDADD